MVQCEILLTDCVPGLTPGRPVPTVATIVQDLEELFSANGPLARALPGFRSRPSQMQMASHVSQALQQNRWLVVEAGTGTGKTLAYLVPALLSGKRVIVSTGTRTLQDQLFHRDLPLLGRVLGRVVRVALLKGRANYLCRERYLRLGRELPLGREDAALGATIARWAESTAEGDLAELAELPDTHPVRERLTSTRDNCTGSRCAEFARCHVFSARRRAHEADLVIVNHHLLLADLALKEEGFGDILPSADAVILDEAHQLPDLAAQFFGRQFGSRGVDQVLADLPTALIQGGFASSAVAGAEAAVKETLRRAVQEIGRLAGGAGRIPWDDDLAVFDAAAAALVASLSELADALAALDGGESLQQCAVRVTTLTGELDAVLHATPSQGARLLAAGSRGFTAQLVPFEISSTLRSIWQSRPLALVFASATLAVAGDFSHFSKRMGLEDRSETLCIESPFDYPRQAMLFLPQGMPEPSAPDFTSAFLQCVTSLVDASQGGAFVLFTSHRALEAAARELRATWGTGSAARYTLLVQSEAPREQLLREFREHGDAVLLGTASFWEGVDVQGQALRLVIIDRLPFASPDDPVLRARLRHAREQGDNPFNDIQVPEAALALKQGVGRLIRSETDQGVVAICDSRLLGRGYGRRLLDSLPPMRRTRELADARQFLHRLVAGPDRLQRA
jgi:ATP-dependent DNA helicase DinG